jgi:hypothetical protein
LPMTVSAFGSRGGCQQHAKCYKAREVVRTVKALARWLCAVANGVCRRSPMRARHRLEPESGTVCKSPLRRVPSWCNRRLAWIYRPAVSLAVATKRRSRVGDEGRWTSSEGLGCSQPRLRNVKGAGSGCHVVRHGQRPHWNKEGGGGLDNTYPLADAQGVWRPLVLGEAQRQARRAEAVDRSIQVVNRQSVGASGAVWGATSVRS